jgi:hypothetical protein
MAYRTRELHVHEACVDICFFYYKGFPLSLNMSYMRHRKGCDI